MPDPELKLPPVVRKVLQLPRRWIHPNNNLLARDFAADLARSRSELIAENALLRQQLIVLERQVKRPKLAWKDRGIMVLLSGLLRTWRETLLIVQPDTVLRWHRDAYRLVWRSKSRSSKQGGRSPIPADIVSLIQRLARENQLWGAERIRGELLKLGVSVAKRTVQKYIVTPLTSGLATSSRPMTCCSSRSSCL